MKRRKIWQACWVRHRWSRWAYVKVDDMPGYQPQRLEDVQFRMCVNCGDQQIRERVCG